MKKGEGGWSLKSIWLVNIERDIYNHIILTWSDLIILIINCILNDNVQLWYLKIF